jgi:hypothetical protein
MAGGAPPWIGTFSDAECELGSPGAGAAWAAGVMAILSMMFHGRDDRTTRTTRTVYDIPSRQCAFTPSGKNQQINQLSDLVLPPDGSLLALINRDRILEVFRVPKGPAPFQVNQ